MLIIVAFSRKMNGDVYDKFYEMRKAALKKFKFNNFNS